MRIILTIGMLLYSWALFAQTATERGTPRPLTFEEALLQMEQRNGEIQAAKREIEEMEYEQKAAWGLRLPSVTASAFLVRMDDDLGIETGKLTGDVKNGLKKLTPENIQTAVKGGVISLDEAKGIQTLFNGYKGIQKLTGGKLALPEKLVLQDQQFHAANVSAMLPIYAGGKIRAAYRAANLRRHEAEEKLRSVRGKLLEELVTRYYGHRLAERVVQIRKEVLAGVEHHLKDARKLEKNGMIAEAQRLYAEMAYSEASRELKKARNRLALTGTGLANTLASDVSVQPTSELFQVSDIKELAYFQQLAGENSPLLRQIGSKKELAHQKAVKERAEFLPTVFATGNKEIYQQHVLNGMTPSWFVGLGVKWTLFDGGRRWNHLRAARKLEQRVEALEDKYQDDIKAGVQKYYNELNQARDQLQSIGTSIKFAKEYLRVKEKAFREGMAESTSVVDARLNLSKVEVEQMKALYDFDVALAKLLVLSGRSEWFVEYAQRQ